MLHLKCDPTRRRLDSRLIARNTRLERNSDGSIGIRLHSTQIVVFDRGRVFLYTGGWNTCTTRERMDRYTPRNVRVSSQNSTLTVIFLGPDHTWSDAAFVAGTEGMSFDEHNGTRLEHGHRDMPSSISGFTGGPSNRGRVGRIASRRGLTDAGERMWQAHAPVRVDHSLIETYPHDDELGKYASHGKYEKDLLNDPISLLDRIDALLGAD